MKINIKSLPLFFLLVLIFSCSKRRKVASPSPFGAIPSKRQIQWHKMERYAFLHFNMNTFTGQEWGYGDADPAKFNPTDFDADQIIGTLAKTGFKGAILTVRHHDGFNIWPSKYSDYTIAQSNWENGNGDVIKEIADACHKYHIKFGIYLSPWDRHRADYGKPGYIAFYKKQLHLLLTNYGKIFEVWFDGANGGDGYYGGAKEERRIDRSNYYEWSGFNNIVHKYQPGAVIFSDAGPDIRWVGNENGHAADSVWATYTPEPVRGETKPVAGTTKSWKGKTGTKNGKYWMPAEADVSIRPGWFYHTSEDGKVKTLRELLDIYYHSVGRGGTLNLNVPPDRTGQINEIDSTRLEEFNYYLQESFGNNLFDQANATSSIDRGYGYKAKNVLDEDYDSYWAMPDSIHTGNIEIKMNKKKRINCIKLQEYIPLGQRIDNFSVEMFKNGNWQKVAKGSTVGYNRIVRFSPVRTDKIRIKISNALACPTINKIGGYYLERIDEFKSKYEKNRQAND